MGASYIGIFTVVMERYELHHKYEQWNDLGVEREHCYTRFQ